LADQLKNGLPKQCLFMSADGEIIIIEYGKAGFSRSELSTDNRKANQEIVNSYNERHGITAEQVELMCNGALFGWDTLHVPHPSYRQESSVTGGRIFEIEISRPGSFGANTSATLTLPASPYELADALDKARVTDERVIYSAKIIDSKLDYLPQFLSPSTNLYELNHLAQRLAALSEWELDCFEGMVMMDTVHTEYAPIAVERLINMTQSTADCQVVYEAYDNESLGKFYAENGFVPELETLQEKVFPWLDYGKIGKEMHDGEGGVFTPSGYVVQNGEIAQVYQSGAAIPREKPDYMVLLKVTKGEFNDPKYNNNLVTSLKLPANREALFRAVGEVDAASPEEGVFTAMDCAIPRLTEKITEGLEDIGYYYGVVNKLAEQLQELDRTGDIPIYKAMLEASPKDISLEDALDLAYRTEDFSLMRDVTSPEDYARDELSKSTIPLKEKLFTSVNLSLYGVKLMEQNGAVNTDYGILQSRDGQTVEQCLGRPDRNMEMR